MTRQCTVMSADGRVFARTVAAISDDAEAKLLRAEGLRVLWWDKGPRLATTRAEKHLRFRRHRSFDHATFAMQLGTLVQSAIPVPEALSALRANSSSAQADVIALLEHGVREGRPLSDAMGMQKGAFPDVLRAMLKAAEKTSGIAAALAQYSQYARRLDAARRRMKSLALYPAVLLSVGICVIAFLLMHVVPRFAAAFEGTRAKLPWAGQLLLDWGAFVLGHGWSLAAAFVGALMAAVMAFRTSGVRRWLVERVTRWPVVGPLILRVQLARVFRTLAMLLRGGYPLAASLLVSASVVDTRSASLLARVRDGVLEGRGLSESLVEWGLTTPVSESLLRAGERSGALDRALEQAAQFLDEESQNLLDLAMRLVEPAIMLVLGVLVGAIVILMYLPIFELAGSL